MIKLQGKYNNAIIFTDFVEELAQFQIIKLLNQEAFKNCNIKIMPDVHAGAGCVIGFTSTINNKVIPNLVGVDIGCGVDAINIGKIKNINFQELDNFIYENIPSGFNKRNEIYPLLKLNKNVYINDLNYIEEITELDVNTILKSLGTLGGGNHFIELNKDSYDNIWICVHSGSRNPGLKVANYFQNIAKEYCKNNDIKIESSLEYLEGYYLEKYLYCVKFIQYYAQVNRQIIIDILKKYFKIKKSIDYISSIHNYIGDDNIIRKGAISSYKNEKLIIPINMKDGSIIGYGESNKDWNYSAPHGAGRLMSRGDAKRNILLEDFSKSMKGIWSSCIDEERLDESPFVYKNINTIINTITESVNIIDIIKPLYNFKG